ncbi:hypothetical protein QT986_33590, partial [Microcoleus sp. herbarium14]
TALAIADEQLFYENLRPKSHFYALRTQLELMLEPQQRQDYEDYIIEQGEIAGHKSLVSSNLEKASDLAVANLLYYFRIRDESQDELELDSDETTADTATIATESSAIKEDSQPMKEFGLTLEQTRIIFSYQYHLVQDDIDQESDYSQISLKQEWLRKWEKSTMLFLKIQVTPETTHDSSLKLITNFDHLQKSVTSSLIAPGNQLTRYLTLLEVTLFQPYYRLSDSRDRAFKDLKIANQKRLTGKLRYFATKLDIDPNCVLRFKSNYKETIKEINGDINPWFVGTVGLEFVIKEIIYLQKNTSKAQKNIKLQEIIKQLKLGIRSLEDQRDALLREEEKDQKEIENLKKAIEYLNKALERFQALM